MCVGGAGATGVATRHSKSSSITGFQEISMGFLFQAALIKRLSELCRLQCLLSDYILVLLAEVSVCTKEKGNDLLKSCRGGGNPA